MCDVIAESGAAAAFTNIISHTYKQDEWQSVAQKNTRIYEIVFRGKIDPTDQVSSLNRLSDWRVSINNYS